jgi:trk system potassium uptake protein
MAGEQVVVIGLGRFGSAVALELERLGHEVLAIDRSEARVNDIARDVTHALELDAADEDALRSAGAADFTTAIVAISSDAESSIFATMVLKRLGVRNVIAKAGSALHGEILARAGADRVVYPERSAAGPFVQRAERDRLPGRRSGLWDREDSAAEVVRRPLPR